MDGYSPANEHRQVPEKLNGRAYYESEWKTVGAGAMDAVATFASMLVAV